MELPIHLDKFFLTKTFLKLFNFEKSPIPTSCDFDYEVLQHRDEPLRYALALRVFNEKIKDSEHSYFEFDFEIRGYFTFNPKMTTEQRNISIRVNGATILYGILRGQIAMMTGCYPRGALTLPTVMMEDVVSKVEARRAAVLQTPPAIVAKVERVRPPRGKKIVLTDKEFQKLTHTKQK